MNGKEFLDAVAQKLMKVKGTSSVSDTVVAKFLGVTPAALANYRKGNMSERQMMNLLDSYAKARLEEMVESTVVPLVEFLPIDWHETTSGRFEVFSENDGSSKPHPYLSGLKKRLGERHGIYVFHDSRGRSIYAGKAQRLTLWTEINNAFNRDRREVQSIKRVAHPEKKVAYKGLEEKRRQIVRKNVPLHEIASYFSAFEVPDRLIGKFEALIVRAFANDLLNVRMENF